ncbi:MAG: hypothetical protein L0387_22020 [Acidobacteria bacterium]|nr:hypothetical protein [Acidobacteriota bacterium]
MKVKSLEITKEGQILQKALPEQMAPLKNTLIEALYPGIEVARVEVPLEPLDAFQQALVEQTLAKLSIDGKTFCLVGASGSAKNGKSYAVDAAHAKAVAERFQHWPEAAISYFGILVSECRFGVVTEPAVSILVVPDRQLGTNDCRGWISRTMLSKFRTPAGKPLPVRHFYQFRMAFETLNAKGGFKVMTDEVAQLVKTDIILPESCLKPALKDRGILQRMLSPEGRRFRGQTVLGIREVSRDLEFRSSYTLTVHAPEDSLELEILPAALEEVSKVIRAAREGSYAELLELLGASDSQANGQAEEGCTSAESHVCNAVLKADGSGLMVRHPFVNGRLQTLLARWAFNACTSGGFKLPAFALADDGFLFVHQGEVICGSDWIPENTALTSLPCQSGLVVRYPIRMKEDLLPVRCLATGDTVSLLTQHLLKAGISLGPRDAGKIVDLVQEQLRLEGTLVLNSRTASRNGGDFDFDTVCLIEGTRFPRWVQSRLNAPGGKAQEKKKLAKKKSPWWNLPQVAMSARGNQIGSITDLITCCLAAAREDQAYRLAEELQAALDGLKHGTVPDAKLIAEIRKQIPRTPWLELKRAKKATDMPLHLEVAASDRVGRLYNLIRKEIEDLFGESAPLAHFKGLITGHPFSREMFDECQVVNQCWAAAVTAILETQQKLNQVACQAQAEFVAAQDKEPLVRNQALLRRNQAWTALRQFEDQSAERFRNLIHLAQKWAGTKTENRAGWAQALLHITSNGKGRGALLFHTFAQELVDSLVEKTGGRPVMIAVPELPDGSVSIEHDGDTSRIFLIDGQVRALLLEVTTEGDVVMDGRRIKVIRSFPMRSGPGEIRDGKLAFSGIPQRPGVQPSKYVN